MNDDQIDVKEPAGEEASITESSPEEPKAAEEAPTMVTEVVPEEDAETGDVQKKGAQSRIRELNAKAKAAEERANGLENKIAEITGRVDQGGNNTPYTPQFEPGREYDTETLKQEVYKTADSIASLRVKQSEAVSRIRHETEQVIDKFPELDPGSDTFDKELSDTVTEAVGAYVMGNPYTASPKKFVNKLMKPYKRAVTKGEGQATEKIAKQVSQAATRPTAVSSKRSKPNVEKSIEELEKELGFHY